MPCCITQHFGDDILARNASNGSSGLPPCEYKDCMDVAREVLNYEALPDSSLLIGKTLHSISTNLFKL